VAHFDGVAKVKKRRIGSERPEGGPAIRHPLGAVPGPLKAKDLRGQGHEIKGREGN
jgi:hypothetical protein